MKSLTTPHWLLSLTLTFAGPAFAGNWPNWRGPEGNGVSRDKNLSLKWNDKENVRWRAELPGPGNSSPIVWADRVFVAQFVANENRRTLMCFDRATGKLRRQSGVTYTENESTQENQGHLYTISQEGIAECFELSSGQSLWQERLSGPGAQSSSWSSTLLADGKIYVPNKSGDVFVLRAAPKFEVLATNSIGEPTNASLAASNDELFLRTDKALWCFAAPK